MTASDRPEIFSVRRWFYVWFVLAAVVAAYLPVWHVGFIWDDDSHLTANATIVGPLLFLNLYPPLLGLVFLAMAAAGLLFALGFLRLGRSTVPAPP